MSIRNTLALASPKSTMKAAAVGVPPCDEVGAESAASGFAFSTIKVFDYVPFISLDSIPTPRNSIKGTGTERHISVLGF